MNTRPLCGAGLSLLLAACGRSGGGSSVPTPTPSVAPSPSATLAPSPSITPTPTPTPSPPANRAALQRVRSDLLFTQPVDLQFAPDGQAWVVEQAGAIWRTDLLGSGSPQLVLDIRDRVLSGGEQGLLGLAFDPDFSRNGHLYLNYTADAPRRTVIARYTASAGRAAAGSEAVVLEVAQPFANHNAGALMFGPSDGLLYIPLGDGGSGGDPEDNGQDPTTLLGSVLRIDVSTTTQNPTAGAPNYGVPPSNPFVGRGDGSREEIYAYGFRNPFRASFDTPPGGAPVLWLADVGQNAVEEIDQVEAGLNYGWNVMEGSRCHEPAVGCSTAGLTLPVAEYGHDVGRSVTGGYVYRGSRRPDLAGHYLYADFITGAAFALPADLSGPAQRLGDFNISPSSFARDASGEVYVVDYRGGIYRFATR